MSPFVWREGNTYRIMVRGVPWPLGPSDPTGIIAGGSSTDGLTFTLDDKPAIDPGPDPDDAGGVEDPTVVLLQDGRYLVFYTGVDAARKQSAMILAEGSGSGFVEESPAGAEGAAGRGQHQGSDARADLHRANGGCSTNMPPTRHLASAWPAAARRTVRGPCCPIRSASARTAGTIGTSRPGR